MAMAFLCAKLASIAAPRVPDDSTDALSWPKKLCDPVRCNTREHFADEAQCRSYGLQTSVDTVSSKLGLKTSNARAQFQVLK